VESLIKAGAFDAMGHPRQGLLTVYEQIIDSSLARRREHEMGVQTLFGLLADGAEPAFSERVPIPPIDFAKRQKLAFEKEMLGLYISDHPLMGAERFLARKIDCTLSDLVEKEDGSRVVIGGVVTGLVRKWTKKGDLMAVFTLEDLADSVECMVFPKTMQLWGHLLTEETNDQVVLLEGRVDRRDDLPKVVVSSVELADLNAVAKAAPLRLRLSSNRCDQVLINQLKDVICAHPGEAEVFVHLETAGDEQVIRLADEFAVDTSNGLVSLLRELLPAEAVLL
jgi:DNA polymerase-3 subunit alpha